MSGGTTRHRRPSPHLVEVRRPNSWDDDDEATRFYQRASAPPRPPLPYDPEPEPAPLDIADEELTILLPRLVEPRRQVPPRPMVARPQAFVPPAPPRARERAVTPIGVQRRDHQPRMVEPPAGEVTQVAQPQRRDAARVAPPRSQRAPRTLTMPQPRLDPEYEPQPLPQPQFFSSPVLMPADYLSREFGRPRRRRAGVPLVFCVLVGGLSFLAARAWHSAPSIGTAVVATTPVDARIFVDGRELIGEMSPFKLADLDVATEHLIEVSKPGFISQTRRVRIDAGDIRVLPAIELEAAQAENGSTSGQVLDHPIAQTRAQRAALSGDSARGASARRSHSARRPSGSSTRSAWRAPAREPVEAADADEPSLAPTPNGPDGTLRINSLPWAEVFIDERSIGTTPQLHVPLAPGRHKVRLVNPELAMVKGFIIDIKPGKTLTKLVQMVE